MKRSRRWLCLIAVAALVAGLALPAAAAKKVTLLIHPTLFKAAGGPKGVVADLEKEKGISQRQRSKVVMVTSKDTSQDKLKSFRCDCDGFVPKPFNKGKIQESIESLGMLPQTELAKAA